MDTNNGSSSAINAALPLLPEDTSIETSEAEARPMRDAATYVAKYLAKVESDDLESVIACLGDDAAALRAERGIDDCEIAANMERAAVLLAGMLPKRTDEHDVADTGPSPMYEELAKPALVLRQLPDVEPADVLQALAWALRRIDPSSRGDRFAWAEDILRKAQQEWYVDDVTAPWLRPAKTPHEGVADPLDPRNAERVTSDLTRQFATCVAGEVARARVKWPGNRVQLAALTEEVGELAKALLHLDYENGNAPAVWKEAVQVGAMAVRVATEGDSSFGYRPVCGAPVAPSVVPAAL